MDLINRAEIQNNLFSQLTEKNLERMRNQSKFGQIDSEKDMEKVARDFESVFVNKLFQSMKLILAFTSSLITNSFFNFLLKFQLFTPISSLTY